RVVVCVQDTNTWVDELLASVKERLQILRLPLAPAGSVRNEAVKHARTEWVAFCDGDDVWCKEKTSRQLEFASKNYFDFVACDHFLTDEAGRVRAVALAMYIPMPSSWLVRTRVMLEHPFRTEKKFNGIEDHEWWFETKKSVLKHRLPKLLLRYRVRGI